MSWLGWAAAVALPVISATCPGQHTWTANGVVEGTFEGTLRPVESSRASAPHVARDNALAHPVGTSKSNLGVALGLLLPELAAFQTPRRVF